YILDSKFTENEVDNNGGVLFIFDFQFLGIANSEFSENNAGGTGGCIYMQGADLNANATILDCTFSQNTANSFGGVFYNFYVNTKINRCKFYNNTAPSGGGAFLQANAGGSVQNSVFKDNSGGSTGNATYSFYDESDAISQPFTLAFTNCSFSENDNANNGGTTCYMNHSGTGSVNTFENCILWNNGTSEILTAGDATATLNYSILDDGNNNGIVLLPNNVSGSNNLDIDPLFTDNSLTIACESPAVDMGSDATNVGGIDIAGNDRNISLYATGQTRDIGAFEVQSRAVCDCNSEGMICDDMNANTYNDTLNAACECVGIPISNGCIAGEMEEFSGAPGDLNLRFTTVNSLSCTSGTLTGEAHITYRQYLMDDWFTFEGLACNETSPIKIRRPKRLREPAAVSRNRYDYCFMETWEMENETCVSDILTISVYVYSDETFATDLTLNQATIPSDLYIASNQISAQGGVATNDTVNLVAGNAIVLSPGFVVNSGATFSARISAIPSCNTSQRIAPAVPNEPILTTTKVPQSPTLAVYPNPANIEITIAYQLPELSTINVGLYSLNGQLLETISSNQVAQRGDHFINLNVADYPKGIYFISLRTEQYQEIRKIVVQ
ncbi:MAG: T9SS type A sorting domain-containing protein, partial [Bacteroidota bacterium]